jgi:hypothetical protein
MPLKLIYIKSLFEHKSIFLNKAERLKLFAIFRIATFCLKKMFCPPFQSCPLLSLFLYFKKHGTLIEGKAQYYLPPHCDSMFCKKEKTALKAAILVSTRSIVLSLPVQSGFPA